MQLDMDRYSVLCLPAASHQVRTGLSALRSLFHIKQMCNNPSRHSSIPSHDTLCIGNHRTLSQVVGRDRQNAGIPFPFIINIKHGHSAVSRHLSGIMYSFFNPQ